MLHLHPIIVKLKDKRLLLHRSQREVALEARISETFVSNHEKDKFSALTSLDRWCNELGYCLVLEDAEEVERREREQERIIDWRAIDWHLNHID